MAICRSLKCHFTNFFTNFCKTNWNFLSSALLVKMNIMKVVNILVGQNCCVFTNFWRIFDFLDTYIQKAKKTYQDSRSRRNLNTLNTELHDVQRIMVQNIDDVLQRGAVLSGKKKIPNLIFDMKKYWFCITELDTKAQNLKHHSSKYKKDASLLNATSWMAIGAGGTILFLVFFIWYKFLLWNCFFENNFVIGKKKTKIFSK